MDTHKIKKFCPLPFYEMQACHYYLSNFKLIFHRFRGNMTSYERRDFMDKNSALYQLMDLRLNEFMNEIVMADEEYQAISRRSNEYSEKLDAMHLSKEVMDLIDHYVSEQNAIGSRYGVLAYLLGFSDCRELLFSPSHFVS